jgi:acyl transferase domain-containing protein/acyl carrier protein
MSLAGEEEGWLFTGRVSLGSHPWLSDHAVMGQVLMPGSGFVELALAAAERVGAEVVEELALERPLLLGEEGGVQIQLSVSDADEAGRRSIGIYSRPQGSSGEEPQTGEWTRHASGVLGLDGDGAQVAGPGAPGVPELEALMTQAWPPPGAQELDTEFLYDRLAEVGYNYGPTFQGLSKAFEVDGDLCAEVGLDREQAPETAGFGIHPALLDSTLHAAFLRVLDGQQASELEVPFAFSGVRLLGQGASALRVRLGKNGDAKALSLLALDEAGAPVLSIEALETRAIDQAQLEAAKPTAHDALYELRWVKLQDASPSGRRPNAAILGEAVRAPDLESPRYPDLQALQSAIQAGAEPPDVVLVEALTPAERAASDSPPEAGPSELAASIQLVTERTLELLKAWIKDESLAEARLLLVTEGAVAVADGEAPSLLQGALVGLMRSAQSEHPGRFGLLDLDGSEAAAGSLHSALTSEEPEFALRAGVLHAPRLGRVAIETGVPTPEETPDGTVLITGGTGGLGALLARHLVTERGVRRLLLASRSGEQAEGANELAAELREHGCDVRIVACDVSLEEQLEELLASVPAEHPLSTVIHTAGVLDDGVIESLDGERLARVMAPKVGAALNLHELAGDAELIFFSSAAATMGSPGQGNYAAANAFLDALAAYRRAQGLPGTSLAWGAWDRSTGMTETLSEADRARLTRMGMTPLSEQLGLELFDLARGIDAPLFLAMRLDTAPLRVQAKAGVLPAILHGLIRMPPRRVSNAKGSLARKLAEAPESEWEDIVSELVRGHVAEVLGHASSEAIDPQRAFKELGFDSLAAVELRNRLSQSTGLKLPSTLIFDHPTSAAVAKLIHAKVPRNGAGQLTIDEGLDRLETLLSGAPAGAGEQARVKTRLRSLLARLTDDMQPHEEAVTAESINSATADDIFELIDKQLGEV